MTLKKKRLFSLEEANAALPELERQVRHLHQKKEVYSRTHDALFLHELVCAAEKAQGFSGTGDDLEAGIRVLEEAIEALAKDVEAIFAMGAILRDLEKGCVEFPGEWEGRKIYFSWKMGDTQIRFYRLRGKAVSELQELPSTALRNKQKV